MLIMQPAGQSNHLCQADKIPRWKTMYTKRYSRHFLDGVFVRGCVCWGGSLASREHRIGPHGTTALPLISNLNKSLTSICVEPASAQCAAKAGLQYVEKGTQRILTIRSCQLWFRCPNTGNQFTTSQCDLSNASLSLCIICHTTRLCLLMNR